MINTLKKTVGYIGASLNFLRLIPHLILLNISKNREIIQYDVECWQRINKIGGSYQKGFCILMNKYPEFRNLFYYRIGGIYRLVSFLCPKMNTLFIEVESGKIGRGLFIRHGFSTIIAAKSIGENCWIFQQVTIGYTNTTDCPILGDNVKICAGAKVLGKVTIGKNSVIGANAVVIKNVPEDCNVVGIPAYIIRRNGVNVKEPL